jgi:uncharacterized membrane-anchored protein
MNRWLVRAVIAFGIVAQFAVVGWMIFNKERTLRDGTQFRFIIDPVDPYDAFKGRFVRLGIPSREIQISTNKYERGESVYVTLGTDTNGFSRLADLTHTKPGGQAFFKTRVSSCYERYAEFTNNLQEVREKNAKPKTVWRGTGKWNVRIDVPFDEYYLPEGIAPEADKTVRQAASHSGKNEHQAVVLVRFLNGNTAVEGLEIDGVPLIDFVLKDRKPKKEE